MLNHWLGSAGTDWRITHRAAVNLLTESGHIGNPSGTRLRRFDTIMAGLRTFTVGFAVLYAAVLPCRAQRPTTAPQWDLPALMASLRQVHASTAHFVETKYLHLLNQAQQSSGRLIYAAPDRLQKETTEPAAARLTIAGDRLTIERQGEQTRDISLRDHPEIGALADGVRATLAGDLPALIRSFTPTLEGGVNGWTLSLVPREPKSRELVAAIRITGARTEIREIETMESDGDRTVMTIIPATK